MVTGEVKTAIAAEKAADKVAAKVERANRPDAGPPLSKAGVRMEAAGKWDGITMYRCPQTGQTALDAREAFDREHSEAAGT